MNCRITPAYAGKSISCHCTGYFFRDHPRLCGEKRKSGVPVDRCRGSPPPMRGKERSESYLAADCRITPAYAGKRSSIRTCGRCAEDHPRLCGEKTISGMGDFNDKGSPPPMRGKAQNELFWFVHFGITPAYAGKSWNGNYAVYGK